jgi:hypothetical protein
MEKSMAHHSLGDPEDREARQTTAPRVPTENSDFIWEKSDAGGDSSVGCQGWGLAGASPNRVNPHSKSPHKNIRQRHDLQGRFCLVIEEWNHYRIDE